MFSIEIKITFSHISAGYSEPMLILSELVAQIDVLVSFASVAASAPTKYVRPKLLPKGKLLDLFSSVCRHITNCFKKS